MIRSAIASLCLILALTGCGSGAVPLVTVGSQSVTTADYERAARGALGRYQGPPEIARAQLMHDLQRRAVMLELAHQLKHDQLPGILNTTRQNEKRGLLQTLYARAATQAQRVSEAEARALFEARKEEAELYLIYTSERETALHARARILGGDSFESMSRSLNIAGQLPQDGNMGFVAPGGLPAPFDHAMRTLPVGEIGGPYRMRDGWFLMKVAQRRPRMQGDYEAVRSSMFDILRQRKQHAAFARAYQGFQDFYDVRLALGAAQLLFRVTSPLDPIKSTSEMKRQPLATYRGGVYTLQDAFDDLENADVQRPSFQLLPAIEIWIESQAMTRVSVLEARRRGIDREPEFMAALRAQTDELLLEGIYQNAVMNVPPPSPELVAVAWERAKPQFTRLESVRLAVLESADSSLVLRVAQRGLPGLALADAALSVDASLAVTEQVVAYPNDDPAWSAMLAMFTQMPPGGWYGPDRSANGYRILQLVEKTVAEQEFDQLPGGIQQSIIGSASELARESRFNEFTDSLTLAYKPTVRSDLVAKLPWPVRPPLDVSR